MYVDARLDSEHGFSEPSNDMLGYVGEQVYVANRSMSDGSEQFVAATNRPHVGEALHAFLELMAPFRFNGADIDRKLAARILGSLTESSRGSVFDTGTKPLHFKSGHLGVGNAVTGFVREVSRSWQGSLADDSVDDPFAKIAAEIRDLKSYGYYEDDIDTLEGVSRSSLLPEEYKFPKLAYRTGLFAVSAWMKDENNERSFLDHRGTIEASRRSLPIQGLPDSYLGKLMIKHFSGPEEFTPREDDTWVPRVSLAPGGKKNKISIRELAPWIQLPMHQPSLVNSSFIQSAEALIPSSN